MATDVERLAIVIEAQTRQFERKINQLERQMDGSMRRSSRSVGGLNRAFASAERGVQGFMRSFAPLMAGAGIAGGLARTKRAMEELDALAKQIQTVGLSSEFYQGVALAVEEASVTQDTYNRSLEFFARNLGLAAAGQGELVNRLRALNPELLQSLLTARNQDQALRMVSDAMAQMLSATDKAALATSIFGESGVDMVRVLDSGSAALDATTQKARELGLVIDRDLLASAEDLQNELGVLQRVIDVQLNSAFVNLGPVINSAVGEFSDLAREINQVSQNIDELTSNENLSALNRTALALSSLGIQLPTSTPVGLRTDQMRRGVLGARRPVNDAQALPGVDATENTQQAQALRELQGQLAATEDNARRVGAAFAHFEQTGTQAARSTSTALREVTGEPMQLLNDRLQSADDAAQAFTLTLNDLAQGAIGDLNSALSDGKIEWEEWANIGLNALQRILGGMNQFGGMGGGGNILSSLFGSFGGFFANGGNLSAGQWGIAGERGPEIIHGPATITPMQTSNRQQPQTSTLNMNIGISGSVSHTEMQRFGAVIIQAAEQRMDARIIPKVATTTRRQPGLIG